MEVKLFLQGELFVIYLKLSEQQNQTHRFNIFKWNERDDVARQTRVFDRLWLVAGRSRTGRRL